MPQQSQRTVGEVGEQRLIEMIRRAVTRSELGDVARLGDDAAILPQRRSGRGPEVVSTDLLIEGTHWRPDHLTPALLGRRALAVNLSDLAAMGAAPRWFTLGLGMPPSQPFSWFQGFLRGLLAESDRHGCPLVGGDLVRAPVASIAITVSGQCVAWRPIRRDTARPGETICLTGDIGRARLALEVLEGREVLSDGDTPVTRRHRRVEPRLREAKALAALGAARSMIDLSDGLLSDLGWICRLSRVGAEVHLESLPILPVVRRHLESRGIDPAAWSAASGEEFELLFTTRVEVERLRTEMRRRGIRTRITAIGKTVSRPGIRWLRGGKALRLDAGEVFAHFSQGGGPGRR